MEPEALKLVDNPWVALVVIVLFIGPQILTYLNSRDAKRLGQETKADTQKVRDTLTTNNGGGHVKDSLDRLERNLAANTAATHEAKQAALEAKTEASDAKVRLDQVHERVARLEGAATASAPNHTSISFPIANP